MTPMYFQKVDCGVGATEGNLWITANVGGRCYGGKGDNGAGSSRQALMRLCHAIREDGTEVYPGEIEYQNGTGWTAYIFVASRPDNTERDLWKARAESLFEIIEEIGNTERSHTEKDFILQRVRYLQGLRSEFATGMSRVGLMWASPVPDLKDIYAKGPVHPAEIELIQFEKYKMSKEISLWKARAEGLWFLVEKNNMMEEDRFKFAMPHSSRSDKLCWLEPVPNLFPDKVMEEPTVETRLSKVESDLKQLKLTNRRVGGGIY